MNSDKTRTKGLPLRLRFVLALVALAVSLGWVFLRHAYAPQSENVTETALASWWRIQFAYGGAFLLLLGLGLFLPFGKRLRKSVLVTSIANLFMTGLLFGVYFVTADSLVQPVLSRLGLSWLSPTLLALAILWAVVFFYLFGTEVDASKHRDESGTV